MVRNQVFISYSHADSDWLRRLRIMLTPLERKGMLKVWADTDITPGQLWKEEIKQALARAKVAVLLVSPDFLASEFIAQQELLPLLEAARKEGLRIFWVPLRYSLYEATNIAHYQAVCNPSTPLSTLTAAQQEAALVKIVKELMVICSPSPEQVPQLPSLQLSELPRSLPVRSVLRDLLVVLVVKEMMENSKKFDFNTTTCQGFSEREQALIYYRSAGIFLRFWWLFSVVISLIGLVISGLIIKAARNDDLRWTSFIPLLVAAFIIWTGPPILKFWRLCYKKMYHISDDEE